MSLHLVGVEPFQGRKNSSFRLGVVEKGVRREEFDVYEPPRVLATAMGVPF